MHHVALDRPGADNGDLDHQIVEFLRAQPGQHGDLGTGFDLEHADGIAAAEHPIHIRVFARHIGKFHNPDQIERAADAGEHAERQHIHLHDAERVDVVLVPLDEGAVLHRRVADRHRLVQTATGQHEAADMLGQMAGQADQFAGQFDGTAQDGAGGVDADFGQPLVRPEFFSGMARLLTQQRGGVVRQAHRLADVADGAFRAVMDDRGGDARAVATVAGVDILDDLLAPFMLEIHVDVGRFLAFGGDEAGEQQVDLLRIDGGDAKAVADRRIGRRPAALTQNAARAGMADDIMHRQEIAGVVKLRDQRQLRLQGFS